MYIIFSAVNLIENANMNLEQIILLPLTLEKYEISALKLQAANCVNKMIELQRNSFKLGLDFSNSKGATYIRGFAINFSPRSTRFKVGVRPIMEVRPILGNLRYINLLRLACHSLSERTRHSGSHHHLSYYIS